MNARPAAPFAQTAQLTGRPFLVIDNYDSFTHNLVQYLGEMGLTPVVVRNDGIRADDIEPSRVGGIIISPGPGRPERAGESRAIVARWSGEIPILGVCLGHQAIGEVFGGCIVRAVSLMHGKTSELTHTGHPLFEGICSPFVATRYHSLALDRRKVPECLQVIAQSDDGDVMAIAHRTQPTYGVQFHPESILSPDGKRLLANFAALARGVTTRVVGA